MTDQSNDPIPVWLALGSRWGHDYRLPHGFVRVGKRGVDDPKSLELREPSSPFLFIFIYSVDGQGSAPLQRAVRLNAQRATLPIDADCFWDGERFTDYLWAFVRLVWRQPWVLDYRARLPQFATWYLPELQELVCRVEAMRHAQKEYFRTRSPAALDTSKRSERAVDKFLEDWSESRRGGRLF